MKALNDTRFPNRSTSARFEGWMLELRRASSADWASIEALLRANELPLEGAEQHLDAYVVAERDGAIVATAGLEIYSQIGLLRSVAVTPEHQGQGLGRLVVEAALSHAVERRLTALYLLTTTAADYFAQQGFVVVSRADAPRLLLESEQFCGACPASATFMLRFLTRLEPAGKGRTTV